MAMDAQEGWNLCDKEEGLCYILYYDRTIKADFNNGFCYLKIEENFNKQTGTKPLLK